jgi:hypothetical protein
VSRTSPDWSAELQEALWEAAKEYGVRLSTSEQVAVAREVSRKPRDAATPDDVHAAFQAVGLPLPPAGFARAALKSVRAVMPERTLLDSLLDFRQDAIRNLSREFGGNTKGREDALRNHLLMFLLPRGYAEAHTGRGRTDILIPPPEDTIIETKVWTTGAEYRDGVVELGRYINTEKPKHAYIVVFGDRVPLPRLIADPAQPRAADEHIGGLTVPVVLVPFEVDAPSKAAANERRRESAER